MSRILQVIVILMQLISLFYISGCSGVENSKTISSALEHPYIDPLTDIVIKADLIVLGTITDNRTDVVTVVSGNFTGKSGHTFFTLSIEKVLKGDPSMKEATIREDCAYLGNGMYQWSTTCAGFQISDHVLLGLIREDDFYILYAAPYGELGTPIDTVNSDFWWQGRSRAPLEEIIGRIVRIMLINNIPVTLPASEWPPLPAPEPVSPPKN
jgi:hypothetical protein